jgi:hypothetical protein
MSKSLSEVSRRFVSLGLVATAVAGGLAINTPALAAHPHYLHALSDLRFARWILNRPAEFNVVHDQTVAIEEIDRAIAELKRASIDDGKNLEEHPPLDTNLHRAGRLHKALELIDSAHRDLNYEEDDFAALGWRAAARHHVDEAHGAVRRAIADKNWDASRE